jgi:hypothetical protein
MEFRPVTFPNHVHVAFLSARLLSIPRRFADRNQNLRQGARNPFNVVHGDLANYNLLTRFGNDFTKGNNNQSNFRYQAGVQLRF